MRACSKWSQPTKAIAAVPVVLWMSVSTGAVWHSWQTRGMSGERLGAGIAAIAGLVFILINSGSLPGETALLVRLLRASSRSRWCGSRCYGGPSPASVR